MPEGARGKGNVYNTVARQAAMHSLETVALTKRLEAELMLRFSLGESRMDTIQVEQFGDNVREPRLRRAGHVQRMESGYSGERMLMELPGRRRRARPQGKLMDVVKEDMKKGHRRRW